ALKAGPWPSSVIWGRAQPTVEVPEAEPTPASTINLIATAAAGDSSAFGERLARAGHQVVEIDAVAFAGGGEAGTDGEIAVVLVEQEGEAVAHATQLIAVLARVAIAAAERQIPLWLVTRGAQQATAGGVAGLAGAALWGFGRVVINEIPRLSLRLIDLPPGLDQAACADCIAAELAADTSEAEIA